MYASATCSTSAFFPQTAKRFEYVSFRGIPLRFPGCRNSVAFEIGLSNSVAFEFWVIPLEHVCFCYLFYLRLLSANGETSLRIGEFRGNYLFFIVRLRFPVHHTLVRKRSRNAFDLSEFSRTFRHLSIPRFAEIQLPLNFGVIPLEHELKVHGFYKCIEDLIQRISVYQAEYHSQLKKCNKPPRCLLNSLIESSEIWRKISAEEDNDTEDEMIFLLESSRTFSCLPFYNTN
ncbi:hypothetical protein NC653_019022 [Populus alba x Populus x berolinensis]|uniref:Uncharacterized protein n=1 Tax=Populus alba x Populus x berolinensis TaxID=444605 RepID=A0AAD6VWI3_9ROSI|nr:hypothetical protein NC653_019022 [Populus alba x Populus x berolinensis]